MDLDWTPVDSSFIDAIARDPQADETWVRFQNGSEFPYRISADEHADFAAAPSIGKHWHAHVRPRRRK